jgi:hypothetical protein
MPYILRYLFSQEFAVPAQVAYQWCVDYSSDDPALMGEENAKRKVTWMTDGTALLKETFSLRGGVVEKQKLVHLYPDRLMWVSTHISGPNKHSQFIYEIKPGDDTSSRLEFTARHIEYTEHLTPKRQVSLVIQLCKEDSDLWKRLAKAMETELEPKPT